VDLWDLTRLLLRRWYFAVPMLLASVAVVVLAGQSVSPDYKATGYMQLIPAPSTGKLADPKAKPRPVNPWLDLGFVALGNAAALTVTDQPSLDKLAAEGLTDSVTVILDERTPLFQIEAVGDSKEQATATVRQVIKLLQGDIAVKQKQYGTQAEDTISTLVINDGSTPKIESGKVKRVLIVAAGLGVLITTAATIALDYWLRRRAKRKSEQDGDEDTGEALDTRPVNPPGRSRPASSSRLDAPEMPTMLHPQQHQQPVRPNGNGNVYSGDRRQTEFKAGASAHPMNGNGATVEPPIDATIVLPMSHPPRRAQDKRQ
jgi:hypothetical protein